MPTITLADGKQLHFDSTVTPAEVALQISKSLAKVAIAAKVNDHLVDLSYPIEHDVSLVILTEKDSESLDVIRHSTAHLLAHAVKQLFPEAQVTIGPVIEDGFYYDFSYARAFTPEDLTAIEQRMLMLSQQNFVVERKTMVREQAISLFRDMGEEYKAKIIEDIPSHESLSLYSQGDFIDLCRGPHVPATGKLKHFKLLKIAGAYWRGDARNEMLQRVYGTAWANDADLQAYLTRLEEAEKRDHRKLGKQLDLFHLQEEAPGMVFWHPDGWTVYQVLERYMREKWQSHGYDEVKTPMIADRSLWERSGHWEKFNEHMFITETENREYAIKPMSCPGHIQIFNQGLRSYRDLPLRLAEFGVCHRCEPSGALHGLLRVRGFVQDDAHIFCTNQQIEAEVIAFTKFLLEVYHDFGFADIMVYLSTRPDKRVGDDALWDKSEGDLARALEKTGLKYQISPGEGAFYGPKVEFSLKDSIGRIWQLGTLQLDYCLPERLDARYIEEDGSRQIPVVLHRAIFGTFERFIGIIIEHYAGKFPVWLAPTQLVVLNITDKQAEYATEVVKILQNRGFRAKADLRNEKIGFKIRSHTLQKIPYLLVVGDKEVANQTIAVRTRSGEDRGAMTIDQLCDIVDSAIAERGRALHD